MHLGKRIVVRVNLRTMTKLSGMHTSTVRELFNKSGTGACVFVSD